jgi:AcrR family transcriptional regulator
MPRPKQRTAALRERVVDVAVATLAESGVGGFTTRQVAVNARTSTPAVYELFGDKAGLVREVFFEGFRKLHRRFAHLAASDDARADLVDTLRAVRRFVHDNPQIADVMFARPFADFDPGPAELEAGASVREFLMARVCRCIDAGVIAGDARDIAHALLALVQGLAAQETAGWLGTSKASRDRRWTLAVGAMLDGMRRP